MTDTPTTRYAKTSDGASLAYQTFGEGPFDLLVMQGLSIPIDLLWDDPGLVRIRNRLSTFSRNIWMELRGWGSSERDLSAQRAIDELVEEVTDFCS